MMIDTPVENKNKAKALHQEVDPSKIKSQQKDKLKSIVMDSLGKPKYFSQIRLSNVYSDRWRVDIFCDIPVEGRLSGIPDTKITDSFFIIFRDNEIFSSDPVIEPKYK